MTRLRAVATGDLVWQGVPRSRSLIFALEHDVGLRRPLRTQPMHSLQEPQPLQYSDAMPVKLPVVRLLVALVSGSQTPGQENLPHQCLRIGMKDR